MSLNEFFRKIAQDIDWTEAERRQEIQRKRDEEERRRRRYLLEVQEAEDELGRYYVQINRAKNILDSISVRVNVNICKELADRRDSRPRYVAEEAQAYRKLLMKKITEEEQRLEMENKKREKAQRDFLGSAKLFLLNLNTASDSQIRINTLRYCAEMNGLIQRFDDDRNPLTIEELDKLEFFYSLIEGCEKKDWHCISEYIYNQLIKEKEQKYRDAVKGTSWEWMAQ
jgi:hypothetical protein